MEITHLITRGVILCDESVLLVRQKGMDYTFLPGGHIETGESAAAALKREVEEELGLELRVEEFLGCVEAGWQEEGIDNYEVNLIFKAVIDSLSADTPPSSREEHLEFLWSPVSALEQNSLMPVPLRELLETYAAGERSVWWGSTLGGS